MNGARGLLGRDGAWIDCCDLVADWNVQDDDSLA